MTSSPTSSALVPTQKALPPIKNEKKPWFWSRWAKNVKHAATKQAGQLVYTRYVCPELDPKVAKTLSKEVGEFIRSLLLGDENFIQSVDKGRPLIGEVIKSYGIKQQIPLEEAGILVAESKDLSEALSHLLKVLIATAPYLDEQLASYYAELGLPTNCDYNFLTPLLNNWTQSQVLSNSEMTIPVIFESMDFLQPLIKAQGMLKEGSQPSESSSIAMNALEGLMPWLDQICQKESQLDLPEDFCSTCLFPLLQWNRSENTEELVRKLNEHSEVYEKISQTLTVSDSPDPKYDWQNQIKSQVLPIVNAKNERELYLALSAFQRQFGQFIDYKIRENISKQDPELLQEFPVNLCHEYFMPIAIQQSFMTNLRNACVALIPIADSKMQGENVYADKKLPEDLLHKHLTGLLYSDIRTLLPNFLQLIVACREFVDLELKKIDGLPENFFQDLVCPILNASNRTDCLQAILNLAREEQLAQLINSKINELREDSPLSSLPENFYQDCVHNITTAESATEILEKSRPLIAFLTRLFANNIEGLQELDADLLEQLILSNDRDEVYHALACIAQDSKYTEAVNTFANHFICSRFDLPKDLYKNNIQPLVQYVVESEEDGIDWPKLWEKVHPMVKQAAPTVLDIAGLSAIPQEKIDLILDSQDVSSLISNLWNLVHDDAFCLILDSALGSKIEERFELPDGFFIENLVPILRWESGAEDLYQRCTPLLVNASPKIQELIGLPKDFETQLLINLFESKNLNEAKGHLIALAHNPYIEEFLHQIVTNWLKPKFDLPDNFYNDFVLPLLKSDNPVQAAANMLDQKLNYYCDYLKIPRDLGKQLSPFLLDINNLQSRDIELAETLTQIFHTWHESDGSNPTSLFSQEELIAQAGHLQNERPAGEQALASYISGEILKALGNLHDGEKELCTHLVSLDRLLVRDPKPSSELNMDDVFILQTINGQGFCISKNLLDLHFQNLFAKCLDKIKPQWNTEGNFADQASRQLDGLAGIINDYTEKYQKSERMGTVTEGLMFAEKHFSAALDPEKISELISDFLIGEQASETAIELPGRAILSQLLIGKGLTPPNEEANIAPLRDGIKDGILHAIDPEGPVLPAVIKNIEKKLKSPTQRLQWTHDALEGVFSDDEPDLIKETVGSPFQIVTFAIVGIWNSFKRIFTRKPAPTIESSNSPFYGFLNRIAPGALGIRSPFLKELMETPKSKSTNLHNLKVTVLNETSAKLESKIAEKLGKDDISNTSFDDALKYIVDTLQQPASEIDEKTIEERTEAVILTTLRKADFLAYSKSKSDILKNAGCYWIRKTTPRCFLTNWIVNIAEKRHEERLHAEAKWYVKMIQSPLHNDLAANLITQKITEIFDGNTLPSPDVDSCTNDLALAVIQ